MAGGGKFDAIIVGGGFAGLYMLHRLRRQGLAVRVLEAGGGVGGTWYWNRYPGARCDVESVQYSYRFSAELQEEWDWTERYAAQGEILAYANHVADRFDLRRDIELETRVAAASFEEGSGRWLIETDDGRTYDARFCIMATGCLSSTNLPDFPGLASFEGRTFHTGRWPHAPVGFTGERVGIIGTGSSAIQSIPLIAQEAAHLHVFQRTPSYAVPAHNRPLDEAARAAHRADYPAMRARTRETRNGIDYRYNPLSALEVSDVEREREFRTRWEEGGLPFLGAFADLLLSSAANRTATDFLRARIRETVRDPATAELLSPTTPVGCKRLCVDIGYFETFNRPNVTLVDVRDAPIEAITPTGLRTGGRDYRLDAIVFATGFDAMTGALLRIAIKGRDGCSLQEKWADGPHTYLGLMVAGFPNLFTITGPQSPSVLTNMLPTIEQHVDWVADCIAHLGREGHGRIEATPEAEAEWGLHGRTVASRTLFPTCNSWYRGANVEGKPLVLMPYTGGWPAYLAKCAEVVQRGYEGFALG